jgi:hypothetical protein
MTTQQMLSQTGAAAPAPGGTGPITAFAGSNGIRLIQINPAAGTPLTGTLEIRGTNKPAPGAGDFAVIATIDFTGHTGPFTLYIQNSSTSMQAVLTAISSGQVSVFGDSNNGGLVGGSGTSLTQSTAVVTAQSTTTVVGQFVHVAAATVPSITSDDVVYALDFNSTVTDELAKHDAILEAISLAGVTIGDLNLLAGQETYGLTGGDLNKLADVDASASELNFTIGVTGGIQAQLDGKVDGAGIDLTGLAVSATDLNFFFDVSPTVQLSFLNTAFTGLIATSADLNALAGTAGDVAAADFVKLGNITASAVEINTLNGLVATATDINILAGTSANAGDVNGIAGIASVGVDFGEFQHLVGLSENVQTALNSITPLTGLNSSVDDLNLLCGAFAGTGAYSAGAIQSAEIAHLNGVNANIQVQLDSKRNTADTIGIAEITGASITTTELNYLSGSTSNIQAQIDAFAAGSITAAGGTFTGAIYIFDGTAAAPGLGYASSNNSGLYLFGATGIGLTVAGTRAATLDGTNLQIGDALTSGQPLAKHSGMGETDPAWSFTGDEDSGMYRVSADSVGIASGGAEMAKFDGTANEVVIGGATAANNSVEVSGIFQGIKELGRVSVLAGATSAVAPKSSPIYTVPAGRSAIVTQVLVRLTQAVVGGGGYVGGPPGNNPLELNIGFTAATYDEIVDNTTNTTIFNPGTYDFDTAMQVMPLGAGDNTFPAISGASGAAYQALAAGAVLTAYVGTLANLDSFDMDVIVLGYEL